MKRKNTQTLALSAVLASLALVLSYMERFFPLNAAIPIPGVKLGLANLVTVFALYALGIKPAWMILITRCILGSVFAGSVSSLMYSLFGGISAMIIMALAAYAGVFSVFGVSVAGAAAHNCGQIAVACILTGSVAPLSYLPVLLLVSIGSGSLNGFLSSLLFLRLSAGGRFHCVDSRRQH